MNNNTSLPQWRTWCCGWCTSPCCHHQRPTEEHRAWAWAVAQLCKASDEQTPAQPAGATASGHSSFSCPSMPLPPAACGALQSHPPQWLRLSRVQSSAGWHLGPSIHAYTAFCNNRFAQPFTRCGLTTRAWPLSPCCYSALLAQAHSSWGHSLARAGTA